MHSIGQGVRKPERIGNNAINIHGNGIERE